MKVVIYNEERRTVKKTETLGEINYKYIGDNEIKLIKKDYIEKDRKMKVVRL